MRPINDNAAPDPASVTPEMGERKAPRRRTMLTGTIHLPDEEPIACIVNNLSELGACIDPGDDVDLPERFEFTPPDGNRVEVELVWSDGAQVGLRFKHADDAATYAAAFDVLLSRLDLLEDQVRDLRNHILIHMRR